MRSIFFSIIIILFLAAGVLGAWGYFYLTRDLPALSTIDDFQPPAVTSVYSRDRKLIAEFFTERRYPVKLKEVPLYVRNSFLAAEDASFYEHPGIDIFSILRALVKNIQMGSVSQGGSTITQQVVKNLLLTPERKIERKLKEAFLSYKIEKKFTKDQILEMYLNQIYFGNSAYGIKAAGRLYFRKELDELTLGEAALLAGLPKAPSRYSPIQNPERAKVRQRYVLRQMVKAGFATKEAAKEASEEQLQVYRFPQSNIYAAPYYVGEIRRVIHERWKDIDLDSGGYEIYTALDLQAEAFARKALKEGLRSVDRRIGWRGPIRSYEHVDPEQYQKDFGDRLPEKLSSEDVYPALVLESSSKKQIQVLVGKRKTTLDISNVQWARKILNDNGDVLWKQPWGVVKAGDVLEVSIQEGSKTKNSESSQVELSQTPELQGAVVLLDPHSGEVLTAIGGYSYHRSQFNRVTQGRRQPGSAFKPVVYLTAVDAFSFTPATLVSDQPRVFRVGEELWSPGNFDEDFMGQITLRVALEKSRNLVSADIISRIGVESVIQYARKLGIESPMGRNLSLSLGSSEVSVLELSRAYGVFATGGLLAESSFVQKIVNRKGKLVYDSQENQFRRTRRVISEESAFLVANLMKGVVQSGTGYRVRSLKRPVAGKTGTSNDHMDAWFVGYTPELVCGVWVGFDVKKEIGDKETGGRVSAPIWRDFMGRYLDERDALRYQSLVDEEKKEAEKLGIDFEPPESVEPADFIAPEGVELFWINKQSGSLAAPNSPGAILEYFLKGTSPRESFIEETANSYLESPEL